MTHKSHFLHDIFFYEKILTSSDSNNLVNPLIFLLFPILNYLSSETT